jgi:TonB-linked SusC/RagA family outer membrane protein
MKHLLYLIGLTSGVIGLLALPAPAQTLALARAHQRPAPEEGRTLRLRDALLDLKALYRADLIFEEKALGAARVPADAINRQLSLEENLRRLLVPVGFQFRRLPNGAYVVRSARTTAPGTRPGPDESAQENTLPVAPPPPLTELNARPASPVPSAPVERTLTGRVTDAATGTGLAGVSIVIKGTARGGTTDADGRYRLSIPDAGATLVFSYVGYLTQEVAVGNQTALDLQLSGDPKVLTEVVVVGYGTQKRADLTGSIASVGGKDIKDLSITRADQALVGKMAGVQVRQANGRPGAGPQIRVRGFNSISQTNNPLIVIDGVPGGDLGVLNPNDIESIDVLKDASAAAIYGSRASNGVVLVTTKRGQAGKTTVTFNAQYGVQSAERLMDLMNARQAAQLQYDGFVQRNLDEGNPLTGNPTQWRRPVPQVVMNILDGTDQTDTDWQRLIFQQAPMQTYQLGINGGSEKMRYYLGGEYLDQDGILIETNYKRYGLRLNLDGQVSERLRVGATVNFAYVNQNFPPTDGRSSTFNALGNALIAMPFYPAYRPDGSYFPQKGLAAGADLIHPVAVLRETSSRDRAMDLTANATAEYRILDGLRAKLLLGSFVRNLRNQYFQRANEVFFDPTAFGNAYSNHVANYLAEYTLQYDRTFAQRHNLSVVAGYTAQREHYEEASFGSNRYPNNLIPTLNAVGGQITAGSSFENEWSLLSWLGRVNYNYAGRYYLTAALRRDGSSRFGPENRWGTFPSAALAWRVSEEAFLRNSRLISNLKIRTAIGTSGNFNIPDFAYLPTVGFNNYVLNNAAVGGYFPNRIANPGLRWERQREINLGADLGLWQDRVVFGVEYYVRRNSDLLLNVNVPGITGFQTALRNIGEVENRGLELTLGLRNTFGKLRWNADLNYSFYRNEVKALGSLGEQILQSPAGFSEFSSITKVGYPVGMFWGWITDGVIRTPEELAAAPRFAPGTASATRVGDFRFRDLNNDGLIDGNDRDVMGNPHPRGFFGITNSLSYGGFEFNFTVQGVLGAQILQAERYFTANMRGRHNHLAIYNQYWRSVDEPGDGVAPRAHNNPTGNNRAAWSTMQLDNGSFVRVNNVTLAYNLPTALVQRIRLGGARVFVNATNAFTFTRYTGYNPDVSSNGSAVLPGIDSNSFPVARVFSGGINLTF